MDATRFDSLTRTLSSRRTALGGLLGGGIAALLGLVVPEEAPAHNLLPGCGKLPDAKKRQACRRRARIHNRQRHTCRPQPSAVTCAGRCGTWTNNCNKAVACFLCPTGRECLNNGSCAKTCDDSPGSCPTGCTCPVYFSVEGARHCIPMTTHCGNAPQACTSTTQCPPGHHCQSTLCGPGASPANRCVPLCPS